MKALAQSLLNVIMDIDSASTHDIMEVVNSYDDMLNCEECKEMLNALPKTDLAGLHDACVMEGADRWNDSMLYPYDYNDECDYEPL